MADFDLAAMLAESVSNLDTGREIIEYIPREQIQADPGNFYSMDGLDELAANISLLGLLDPIRLRSTDDGYVIVSGHRRFAAMGLLAAEGDSRFDLCPSIVETGSLSPAMQELRLIYANSNTRKLSSADLNKQVERVTDLLYQLQEEGVSFPGRMRDHVAQACKLSKSKIARLSAISKGLGSMAREMYETNKIHESVAYALSSLSKSFQNVILTALSIQNLCATEYRISDYARRLSDICKMQCPQGGTCEHIQQKMNQVAYDDKHYNYQRCDHSCCLKCDRLALCKTVCIHAKEAQAEAKKAKNAADKAARDEKKTEAERQNAIAKTNMERKQAMYQLVSQQIQVQGLAVEPLLDTVAPYHYRSDLKSFLGGDYKFMTGYSTVLSTGVSLDDLDRLCAMADYLHMTLDELVMRTPVKEAPAEASSAAAQAWQIGKPTKSGAYAIKNIRAGWLDIAYWNADWETMSYMPNTFDPVPSLDDFLWTKLPEPEEVEHEKTD